MLEHEGVLWTWALAAEPMQRQSAQRLDDHRLAYLEYEGPISGDRGEVTRWDGGTYQIVASTEDDLMIELAEGRLAGRIRLRRSAEQTTTYDYSWDAC
jgi:hypothetical protein